MEREDWMTKAMPKATPGAAQAGVAEQLKEEPAKKVISFGSEHFAYRLTCFGGSLCPSQWPILMQRRGTRANALLGGSISKHQASTSLDETGALSKRLSDELQQQECGTLPSCTIQATSSTEG